MTRRTAADRCVYFRNSFPNPQQNPSHAIPYAPTTKNSIHDFGPSAGDARPTQDHRRRIVPVPIEACLRHCGGRSHRSAMGDDQASGVSRRMQGTGSGVGCVCMAKTRTCSLVFSGVENRYTYTHRYNLQLSYPSTVPVRTVMHVSCHVVSCRGVCALRADGPAAVTSTSLHLWPCAPPSPMRRVLSRSTRSAAVRLEPRRAASLRPRTVPRVVFQP